MGSKRLLSINWDVNWPLLLRTHQLSGMNLPTMCWASEALIRVICFRTLSAPGLETQLVMQNPWWIGVHAMCRWDLDHSLEANTDYTNDSFNNGKVVYYLHTPFGQCALRRKKQKKHKQTDARWLSDETYEHFEESPAPRHVVLMTSGEKIAPRIELPSSFALQMVAF